MTMFLTDHIFRADFEEGRSPSHHFCQIVFNSDHWFQRIFHRYIMETCFLTDPICFSYFVGHPVDYFYQIILYSDVGFREDLQSFCYHKKLRLLVAIFLLDPISLSYFVEGHLRNIPVEFG